MVQREQIVQAALCGLETEQRVHDYRKQRDDDADDDPALVAVPELEADHRHDGEDRDGLQGHHVGEYRSFDELRLRHQGGDRESDGNGYDQTLQGNLRTLPQTVQ